ncbi:DUF2147 domain-containing protein [Candidatus Odyssella acanthamoebae]|uniref:DUF2147 domain-containing protein n=1 Tax=Candidatus Odyssella acanthamoebae TaxID=91604 RepID=UPI00068A801A|nr:DUF2147 domain-containing protein [Candidatus Paracaedibacter acanthamoebae]
MKKVTLLSLIMMGASWAIFNPEGYWLTENNDAKVHIYKCGDKLCGKIVDLKEKCRDGKPKVDEETKQATLGLEIIKGFKPADENSWEDGTVRDPKEGKTYSGSMEMPNNNQVDLRGYVGIKLLGRTSEWRRTNEQTKIPGSDNDQSCHQAK